MTRSKWFTPVFVLLLAALMVTACQSSPAATEPADTEAAATEAAEPTTGVVTLPTASSDDASASGDLSFTDGFGRTVTLEKPATRIVSMAPSNTELVYGLGGGSFMVGRDEFSDYPAVVKDLPSIGGSMGKYDLEAIAALKPDLVLAGGINTIDQVEALENMGITVFYFPNPTNFDELYENILILGRMIGRETRALGVVRNLGARVEAVQIAIEKATDKPLVYYELDATDPAKPYTSGPGTFVDTLIAMAGGENLGASLTGEWAQISQEELLNKNPDVILLGDSAYGVTADSLKERAGWGELSALKNDKVFAFDDNLVSRPSMRLVDGLEQMAKLIHPELFQ